MFGFCSVPVFGRGKVRSISMRSCVLKHRPQKAHLPFCILSSLARQGLMVGYFCILLDQYTQSPSNMLLLRTAYCLFTFTQCVRRIVSPSGVPNIHLPVSNRQYLRITHRSPFFGMSAERPASQLAVK